MDRDEKFNKSGFGISVEMEGKPRVYKIPVMDVRMELRMPEMEFETSGEMSIPVKIVNTEPLPIPPQ